MLPFLFDRRFSGGLFGVRILLFSLLGLLFSIMLHLGLDFLFAGFIPQENLALCAAMAINAGMDEFSALKAITINPARHIGLERRIGSIETGKDADLILIKGSPFSLQSDICNVFINGKSVFSDDLDYVQ